MAKQKVYSIFDMYGHHLSGDEARLYAYVMNKMVTFSYPAINFIEQVDINFPFAIPFEFSPLSIKYNVVQQNVYMFIPVGANVAFKVNTEDHSICLYEEIKPVPIRLVPGTYRFVNNQFYFLAFGKSFKQLAKPFFMGEVQAHQMYYYQNNSYLFNLNKILTVCDNETGIVKELDILKKMIAPNLYAFIMFQFDQYLIVATQKKLLLGPLVRPCLNSIVALDLKSHDCVSINLSSKLRFTFLLLNTDLYVNESNGLLDAQQLRKILQNGSLDLN